MTVASAGREERMADLPSLDVSEQDLEALLRYCAGVAAWRLAGGAEPSVPTTKSVLWNSSYGLFVTWKNLADPGTVDR